MHKLWLQNLHIDQQDSSRYLFMAGCSANRNIIAKLSRSMNQPQSASKLVLQTWLHTLAGCSHASGRACHFCLPRYLPLHNCGLSCSPGWYLSCSAKMRCTGKNLLYMVFTWTWAKVGWKGSKEKLSLLFRSGGNLCCGREKEKRAGEMDGSTRTTVAREVVSQVQD